MTDNELINLLAGRLESASAAATASLDWPGGPYSVVQKNPSVQEGTATAPTIYFEKLFDQAYGWPEVSYEHVAAVPPAEQGTFTQTEQQWVETTFQVSALVIQDPNNLSLPTASDVVNYMKQYINARQTIALFKQQGVSVLRVQQIRNPYFEDDRAGFEANPNFDVVLQHKRSISFTVAATNIVRGQVIEGFTDNGIYPVPD